MALLKALVLADPDNEEAQALQSAIRADVRRDLDDARALLDQSATGTKDDSKKYRKAAEIILLKTLYLDPENQEAKVLLQSARAMSGSNAAVITPLEKPQTRPVPPRVEAPQAAPVRKRPEPEPEPIHVSRTFDPPVGAARAETPVIEERTPYQEPSVYHEEKWDAPPQWDKPRASQAAHATPAEDEIPFTVAPPIFERKEEKKRSKVPIALAAAAVLGVGFAYKVFSGSSKATAKPAPAAVAKTESPARVDNSFSSSQPPLGSTPAPATSAPAPAAPVNTAPPAPVTPPTPPPAAPEVPPAAAAPATGKLAVSSPTSAEIYMGDKLLGSTPTTLELPPGRQRLEYRHGDLRTVVTHDIKANSTVTASVTFQVTVQINARPWAQVYVDGTPRRSLGQTPLSGITVPIGAVLIFENPGFESKTYRVTDKEAAIQVNFP
jgi:hypothetical protein